VSLVVGGYLVFSLFWVDVGMCGIWVMVIIGGVVAIMVVVALVMFGAYIDEWMIVVVGVFVFVLLWIFLFLLSIGVVWTSWVVGVVVALAAVMVLSASR